MLFEKLKGALIGVSCVLIFTTVIVAQSTRFDTRHYVIDAKISPDSNTLEATAEVTFTPLKETRSVTFELNGALAVDKVEFVSLKQSTGNRVGESLIDAPPALPLDLKPEVTFVQDRVGVGVLGPSIRVDLGQKVPKGTDVTLKFTYKGVLETAEGGPLLTKRLAYVGPNEGYLMYAARWFPFNEYAADRATSEITVSVPDSYSLVGVSDEPVTKVDGKQRFVMKEPGLIGNFTYGRYVVTNLNYEGWDITFNTKAGIDSTVADYGQTLGKALDFYTKNFGPPISGKKIIVSQIDDDSLDYYSQEGIMFLANRHFDSAKDPVKERIQREAAFQWWGLTVGLKSFDDAWLSQGLSEYSAFTLRENELTGAKRDALRRELLERSLTFEQTASLARTPSSLDDQSVAYQYIMYSKGAIVFKLLKETIGEGTFRSLLQQYIAQNRGKNVSLRDFEDLANRVSGKNLRYFFARWVEGTGVPEFQVDYIILRNRAGKFVTRGTVKQNYSNFKLPVDVKLIAEGQGAVADTKLFIDDASADFNIESDGKPIRVEVDPGYKLLRISDDLRVSSIARRGIEQFKEGNYAEAQQQFEAALKLDRSNAWVYYNLGLLFLQQMNYGLAIENFKTVSALAAQGRATPFWLRVWSEIKMGNAYDAQGNRERAVAAYKKAKSTGDNYDKAQEAASKFLSEPYDPRANSDNTAVTE